MAGGEFEDRKRLTFEQAEGVEPLPAQLKLKELSDELRALLWAVLWGYLQRARTYPHWGERTPLGVPWERILYDMHVSRNSQMADEFGNELQFFVRQLKPIFESRNYVAVLGLLQWIMRHASCPNSFAPKIDAALEEGHAAYRVLDETTIVPIGSDAELNTIKRAFADLAASEFHGARAHLRAAATQLTAGHIADSIRESIHAVESVVRALEPGGNFNKALAILETKETIHGAMKAGFGSLYGYASDEQGIRHPLLEKDAAKVDETDALFMIGACAAFVSYLINRARIAGVLTTK